MSDAALVCSLLKELGSIIVVVVIVGAMVLEDDDNNDKDGSPVVRVDCDLFGVVVNGKVFKSITLVDEVGWWK